MSRIESKVEAKDTNVRGLLIRAGLFVAASGMMLGAHAATVRAAAVDQVLPITPFSQTLAAQTGASPVAGVTSGRLGISSLTITNFLSTPAYVYLNSVKVSGSNCQTPIIGSNDTFGTIVYVQPTSTLQLAFPTPLVVGTGVGPACFQASTPFGGNVFILAVGESE